MNVHITGNPVIDPTINPNTRKRVAVIGSGISGSSAAWALRETHDVTLFEKASRPGGHTATVDIDYDGRAISVDTGFIVFNHATYPNLTALFEHLNITTHDSNMGFALSLDQGKMEWSGDNLRSLFGQRRNVFRPSFWMMLREILRFNKICIQDRKAGRLAQMSLGDYLNWRGFSPGFTNNYLVPMAAAIWSAPPKQMLEFPAENFIGFFDNHRLTNYHQHPWYTVTGGSRNYLDKLLEPLGNRVRLNAGPRAIRRIAGKVYIDDQHGHSEEFDHIILACHCDQALELLEDASSEEVEILSAIPYRDNRVILHRDEKLMPKRRHLWAAWNYLRSSQDDGTTDVTVSYWMNRLQGIDADRPLFITLNPDQEPDPSKVFGEYVYAHPQFGNDTAEIQGRLATIQGFRNTHFAGAWTGYGFHEDGLVSGLSAAEALGATVPWRTNTSPLINRLTGLTV